MGPLGGTRYGMYAAYWTYGMCMPVLDVWMWPWGDVPSLGLIDGDVGLLRRVDCDILTQGLIGLIEYSYHQGIPCFLEPQLKKIVGLSVLGPKQFQDEWLTRKSSRVRTSEDKSAQKRLGLVCGASLLYFGAARSNDCQTRGGWGVTPRDLIKWWPSIRWSAAWI
jgi:hypothetical protein